MKIFVITDNIIPLSYGGMAQHAFHISNQLSKKNDVLLITPYSKKIIKHDYNFKVFPVLTKKFSIIDECIIYILTKIYSPDALHVCCSGLAFKSISKNIPTFTRVVGNDFLKPWLGWSIYFKKFLLFFFSEKLKQKVSQFELSKRKEIIFNQLLNSEKIFANSHWTKNKLIELGINESKIEIIVGGLDIEVFFPCKDKDYVREEIGLPADHKILITSCNLYGKKGIDNVIKSLPKVISKFKKLKYIIIGRGYMYNELVKITNDLKLNNNVVFLNPINQARLSLYYQSCDLYIQVSRDYKEKNGIDVETMGRTYFEAGACGVPVIGSNVGGIPSVIKNRFNGLLINDPENTNEISETIISLLKNDKLKDLLVRNSLTLARDKFNWQAVSRKFEKLMFTKDT